MQSSCSECGNEDARLFQYDGDNDTTICTNCGFVNAAMHIAEYLDLPVPEDVLLANQQNPPKKDYKGSYERRAYLIERLRAAKMEEPRIPEDRVEQIKQQYNEYCKSNYFRNLRKEHNYITKRDIQQILRALDKKHSPKKKEYTTKYLEKWKTIKKFLGGKVRTYTHEEYVTVGTKLTKMSRKWDEAQPRSRKDERSTWVFPQRMDFPGFNFLVRKIHRQEGIKGMDSSFPLPVTKPALKKLAVFAEFLDPTRPVYEQKLLTDGMVEVKGSKVIKEKSQDDDIVCLNDFQQTTIVNYFKKISNNELYT